MRCLGVRPGERQVEAVERPEPDLPGEGQVLIEMLECGVCATDRHILGSGGARPAPGQEALVLGHEPLGRVLQVGPGVRHLRPGDLVTATNQRGCGHCPPCALGEEDLCHHQAGRGRGVGGADGFLQPRLLEQAAYAVAVPAALRPVAVLTEPLAVVEKALVQVRHIQQRLRGYRWREQAEAADWAADLRFLVGGAGPIGLLAALALRCHGGEVHVLDLAPPESAKAQVALRMGAVYHSTAGIAAGQLPEALVRRVGPVDAAIEAAGSAALAVALWQSLGPGGVLALVGGTGGPRQDVDAGRLLGPALGGNRALFGVVASNPRHFGLALEDLSRARTLFPGVAEALITRRYPVQEAPAAFAASGPDDIKQVIVLSAGE